MHLSSRPASIGFGRAKIPWHKPSSGCSVPHRVIYSIIFINMSAPVRESSIG
jgi:hypothetical protein